MKSEPTSKSVPTQVMLGIAAIGLGIAFLLDNLEIWELRRVIHFWPAVFILLGLAKLWDTRSPHGYLIGGGLIFLGVMMTLHRLGVIYFSMRTMWPLVLIAIGGLVIYKAWAGRREADPKMIAAEGSDSMVDITAILGGFDRRIASPNFRGGEVTAFMGGCELDMRDSSIQGEAVINVFAVFGGISIKVPRDWKVILHGTPIMGGFEEKTNTPPDDSKRLVVRGYAIMGGVEVRN